MSELKPYIGPNPTVHTLTEYNLTHPTDHTLTEYYLKSEADKVIAELKDDVTYWKKVAKKNMDDNVAMARERAKAFKSECHQKYKRCLAMAKWCIAEAKVSDDEYRMYWWVEWHKRWLKIAEKFKEVEK